MKIFPLRMGRRQFLAGALTTSVPGTYIQGNRPVNVYEFPGYTAKEVMAGNCENVGTVDVDTLPSGAPSSGNNKSYH